MKRCVAGVSGWRPCFRLLFVPPAREPGACCRCRRHRPAAGAPRCDTARSSSQTTRPSRTPAASRSVRGRAPHSGVEVKAVQTCVRLSEGCKLGVRVVFVCFEEGAGSAYSNPFTCAALALRPSVMNCSALPSAISCANRRKTTVRHCGSPASSTVASVTCDTIKRASFDGVGGAEAMVAPNILTTQRRRSLECDAAARFGRGPLFNEKGRFRTTRT